MASGLVTGRAKGPSMVCIRVRHTAPAVPKDGAGEEAFPSGADTLGRLTRCSSGSADVESSPRLVTIESIP